jgi:hypothetical protein
VVEGSILVHIVVQGSILVHIVVQGFILALCHCLMLSQLEAIPRLPVHETWRHRNLGLDHIKFISWFRAPLPPY